MFVVPVGDNEKISETVTVTVYYRYNSCPRVVYLQMGKIPSLDHIVFNSKISKVPSLFKAHSINHSTIAPPSST